MNECVNVRTLAEVYYEGGDLAFALNDLERMQEGLKCHLMLQNRYTDSYKAEVPVKHTVEVNGFTLTVQGRVDGLYLQGDECRVEEIKTARFSVSAVGENDYPVHWAQAEIYGFILCETHDLKQCQLHLVYADLSGEKKVFPRLLTRAQLAERFHTYAAEYVRRLKKSADWLSLSVPGIRAGAFPFARFREGQRAFAAGVYHAVKDKTRFLCEAPTGIGKTAAALFPAVKALGEGLTDTLFYLTARTTGRLAAENTLALMRGAGFRIRSVSICAKRKLCPTPSCACDPEVCARARGYFDRQKTAVEESWNESAWTQEAITALADKYRLCPFELALALSETAQVIICDYNYVFDPAVRLKRFFDHSGRYTLLIDECHNLPDRAREMYSAELGDKEIRELRRKVGLKEGRQSPLYASLTALLKSLGKSEECELRSELPLSVVNAAKDFSDTVKASIGGKSEYAGELTELYFSVLRFIRVSGDYDESTYKTMVTPEGKHARIRLWCWNPTPNLSKILKRMRGSILFSATLSPLVHYAGLLDVNEARGDRLMSLASPFPRENLLSLSLDIPTRYSKREESAPLVARAIHALALSRTGNYLACFPSHAYLNRVAELLSGMEPRVDLLLQSRSMTDTQREQYLAAFQPSPARSMVAFIAMGGVFSEGVDLPGDRLIGAAIVGVGLPQICFERDALKLLYDDDEGQGGFQTAYVYPGIGKCLQAAGRVIRTETDRGAVLFIDERYLDPAYASLLPDHLRPKHIPTGSLTKTLARFWSKTAVLAGTDVE